MSKAEEKTIELVKKAEDFIPDGGYSEKELYLSFYMFIKGYHQAEKDIKEELSNLFQEFMLDCVKDDTETHILHFVDVFNNKIKTIGNE